MSLSTPLYPLCGPTASGKTGVAHCLADQLGLRLLSVDSMMVYRGLNIGTAKPSQAEIERYDYAGLDLCEPGNRFSVGDWLRAVSEQLDGRPTLAVGGTGLYFDALFRGLTGDPTPPPSPPRSAEIEALRERILELDPEALTRLADPRNPRRLARALDWLEAGKSPPADWNPAPTFPVPTLDWPVPQLNHRIELRCRDMFARGLVDETAALLQSGSLHGTAAQAIGYREAAAVCRGELGVDEAVAAVSLRTRRYAKRQRTWIRNRMRALPVACTEGGEVEKIADRIAILWQENGPFLFNPFRHV